MKKFLYLLLPFLLLGHASQAQETRPSPWFPEDAEWYYGIHDINMGMGMATGCIHMTVAKDTLFAGRPCKQLKLEACDGKYETLYEYVYPCGDSLFYYNYAEGDFFLLLDLSAKKGDTIWVHPSGFIPNPGFDPYLRWKKHGIFAANDSNAIREAYRFMAYRIKNVDTVIMDGKTLRRQHAEEITTRNENGEQTHSDWFFPGWQHPKYNYVVEGLGSLGGFWGESWGWMPEWGIMWLRCFFAEGKTYLTDGKCDNAAVETSLENPAAFWRLSPQPATESVRAVCEASAVGTWRDGRWRLVDAAGKALQGGVFTDGCFEISLSDHPAGLYFIEITAANGTACRLKCLKATR